LSPTPFFALFELVRMYVGMENDYEFKIRVKRNDIPDKIQLGNEEPVDFNDRNKTVDISISASRLGGLSFGTGWFDK